jgi:hypothetical protein
MEGTIMRTRKVWVAEVPPDNEYGITSCQVMIEQFGDSPPTIALRRETRDTWSRPYAAAERD